MTTSNMTDYQRYIAVSRYARYRDDLGRRETWEETVDRLMDFWCDEYPLLKDNGIDTQLREAIKDLKVMPSMRTLMTAGEALKRDNVAGYNPVVGITPVVTKEYGQVPIETLEGKEATVLNINGDWTKATFRGYGEQEVYCVTTKLNSNTENKVYCTANHRWVLADGTVKPTEDLLAGDRIPFVSSKREIDEESVDYKLGVIHGLVYGDGTTTYSCERTKGYHIRLASDASDLLPWFDNYPVSYPPSANGDPIVMLYDGFAKTHGLKDLPSHNETDEYLIGFIRGWMAADGSVTKSSQVSLCMGAEDKKWFTSYAATLGYVVQREYKQSAETNFGKRKKESWVLYISRSSLTEDDFIIRRKRERFRTLESHYTVSNVTKEGYSEQVYCAEVPDTNTFVLDKGLVTGNCSYRAVDDVRAFDEIMYILLCGTGVGFSVERQYVNNLPDVAEEFHETDTTIVVSDSKIGWASSYRELISLLYGGKVPRWDLSKIRPAGTRLKTFGGRASGPQPLEDLFRFTVEVFKNAKGRKLNSLECHDLVCKVADIVVVGGVRRSALISLSNLTDERMRNAKTGQWWIENPQRALANNSVCYTEKPDMGIFMREWQSLYDSKSGERGIFNRVSAENVCKQGGRRELGHDWGTNPCSEIILRSKQLCNLTEVVVRPDDTLDTLKEKVKLASILGTLQASLTKFRYLGSKWKKNTEEEALLGVSLTGIMDHPILSGRIRSPSKVLDMAEFDWMPFTEDDSNWSLEDTLNSLKEVAVETNKDWAQIIGINPAAAVTCVKPSGTVSQLVDSASGIHPRYSAHYIRTVRNDKKDPLSQLLIDQGVPYETDVINSSNYVFSFPMEAPEGSVMRDDMTAIEQLELWKVYQEHWCEHKPSITVYVREHEWLEVGAWVYEHFDYISGVSFLPHSDHTYQQAPYQEITEEDYEWLAAKMPKVDFNQLSEFEDDDMTTGSQEYACTGNSCEVV